MLLRSVAGYWDTEVRSPASNALRNSKFFQVSYVRISSVSPCIVAVMVTDGKTCRNRERTRRGSGTSFYTVDVCLEASTVSYHSDVIPITAVVRYQFSASGIVYYRIISCLIAGPDILLGANKTDVMLVSRFVIGFILMTDVHL